MGTVLSFEYLELNTKNDIILRMQKNVNSSISKVSKIHSITAEFLANKLKQHGFDEFASSHGNILFQLSQTPKMKMRDLALKINRDKSTTTVLVRKLKSLDLIKEEVDSEDKRNKYISLTENGKNYTKITSELSKELIEKFYKGFTEEEKIQFCSFLERIEKNFEIKD